MLLRVSWGSLGLVARALGGLLGVTLVLLRALGRILDFRSFLGEATAACILRCIIACRSCASSQSLHIIYFYVFLMSSLTVFFQMSVFLLLEPLGVDFELPNEPPHPKNP